MVREETFLILKDYYKNDSYINLLLKNKNFESNVMGNVTLRVYGIINNMTYIDYLISKLISKDKIDLSVKIIMQIAVFEFVFLNKPDYAVVNESVNLANRFAKSAKGYINNKLRDLEKIKNVEINFIKEEKNLEIKYSHPRWIVKLLMKQYPKDYERILESNITKKDTSVRVLKELKEKEKFKKIENFDNNGDIMKYTDKAIVRCLDFKQDNIIIQDVGSYLVGYVLNAQENDVILDLCAAPGSKSMQIARSSKLVVANEINKSRYELLNDNLVKYGIKNIETINCDATNYSQLKLTINERNLPQKYDKILIDAPCSGLGVLRSKPEIKYKMTQLEIDKIIDIQKNILKVAKELLKDDGEIIFSTCTINKEENENVSKWFMSKYNFRELKQEKLKKQLNDDSEVGITLKPYLLNSDGFYVVKMEKNEK